MAKQLFKKEENISKLPEIQRDGSLKSRLMSVVLIGFDRVFGFRGSLYFRLLCRLTDKAFDDYSFAKKLIEKEIKESDKLAYHFEIINHLENCLMSVSRIIRVIDYLEKGKEVIVKCCLVCKGKTKGLNPLENKCNFLKFAKLESYKKLQNKNIKAIRNRIEHIDEDVYLNEIKGGVFLEIDENYKKIILNTKECSFCELVSMIEDCHAFILEVVENLPKSGYREKYYDENGKEWQNPI